MFYMPSLHYILMIIQLAQLAHALNLNNSM